MTKWAVLQAEPGDNPLDLVVELKEGQGIPPAALRIFFDFHDAAQFARDIFKPEEPSAEEN